MKIRTRLAGAAVALTVAMGGVSLAAESVTAAPAVQSRGTVLAGQFCAKADVGKVVTASNGAKVICKNVNGYNRWVVK
jgi:hypothetical protein